MFKTQKEDYVTELNVRRQHLIMYHNIKNVQNPRYRPNIFTIIKYRSGVIKLNLMPI